MSGSKAPEREFQHGSALALGPRGVLIRGAAGSGKSSLLLSLLQRGAGAGLAARLVADDQVIVMREGEDVALHAPEATAGLLEVRGVGILRLPFRTPCPLALVVDLTGRDALQRLPQDSEGRVGILGRAVPRIRLPERDPAFGADVVMTILGCGAERLAVD